MPNAANMSASSKRESAGKGASTSAAAGAAPPSGLWWANLRQDLKHVMPLIVAFIVAFWYFQITDTDTFVELRDVLHAWAAQLGNALPPVVKPYLGL